MSNFAINENHTRAIEAIANSIKEYLDSCAISNIDINSNDDAEGRLRYLSLKLMNFFDRSIHPINGRSIQCSQELMLKMQSDSEINDNVNLIIKKLENGVDLSSYQSNTVSNSEFQDRLYNNWNIKHLHITPDDKSKVLLLIDKGKEVFLIDFIQHPRGKEWVDYDILKTCFKNNWLQYCGFISSGSNQMEYEITDNDTLYNWYGGNGSKKRPTINTFFNFGGTIFSPSGTVLSGEKLDNVNAYNKIVYFLFELFEKKNASFEQFEPIFSMVTDKFNVGVLTVEVNGTIRKFEIIFPYN